MPTAHVTPDSALLLQEIANSLYKAKKVVVVTGAGISTNSGIPDFRSENGLYSLIQAQFDAAHNDLGAEEESSSLFQGPQADTPQERPSKRRRLQYDEALPIPTESPCHDCVEVKPEPTKYGTKTTTRPCSDQLPLQEDPEESIVVADQSCGELPCSLHPEVNEAGEPLELPSDVVMSDVERREHVPSAPDGPPVVAYELPDHPEHPHRMNISPMATPELRPRRPDQAVEAMKATREGEGDSSSNFLSSPRASTPKTSHPSSESGLPSCLLSSSPLSSPPPILFDPYQDASSEPTCSLDDSPLPRGSSPSRSGSKGNSSTSTPLLTSQSSFGSSASSLATLPNLKGRDLFDSSIWADPVKTSVFYTFATTLRQKAKDVSPTASHQFLSVLRDRRKLVRCYTQNIDQLEERVGLATSLDLGPGSRARFSTRGRASGAAISGGGSGSGTPSDRDIQRPENPREEASRGSDPEQRTREPESTGASEQEEATPPQAQPARDEDSKGVPIHKEGGRSEDDRGGDKVGRGHKRARPSPESVSSQIAITRSRISPPGEHSSTTHSRAQGIRHGHQDAPAAGKTKTAEHSGVARHRGGGHIQGSEDARGTGTTTPDERDARQAPAPASAIDAPPPNRARASTLPSTLSAPNRGVECVFLHGSLDCLRCFVCGRTSSWDEADRALDTLAGRQPMCPHCAGATAAREERGKRALGVGKLRPDIVLYGEEHPSSHLISPIVQHDLSLGPDMLLVLGTSLRVHGLKVLVKEFAKAVHSKGGKVVFINYTKPSESVWADVIDFWVQWDCDTWVLDVKSRKPALWLPPGSVAEDEEHKPAKAKRVSNGDNKRDKNRGSLIKKAKKEPTKEEVAEPAKKETAEPGEEKAARKGAAQPAMPRRKITREPRFKPDAKKPVAVRDDRFNGAFLTLKIMKDLKRIAGTSTTTPPPPKKKSRKSAPAMLESTARPPKEQKQEPTPLASTTNNNEAPATPSASDSSIFAAVKLNPRKRKRKVIEGCDIELPRSLQLRACSTPIARSAIRLPTPTPTLTPQSDSRQLPPPMTPVSAPMAPRPAPFGPPMILAPLNQTAPPSTDAAAKPEPLEPRVMGDRWTSMETWLGDPFSLADPLWRQLDRPPARNPAPITLKQRGFAGWRRPDDRLEKEQDAALALSGMKNGLGW